MAFDYDSAEGDPAAVADAIRASAGLPELSDEQKEQRWADQQAFIREQRQRDEEQRSLDLQRRVAADRLAKSEAEKARQEAAHKARREREQRIAQEIRDRELRDLRLKVTQQEWWRSAVERQARAVAAQQQKLAVFSELDAIANPEPPPAEPMSENERKFWRWRSHSWFGPVYHFQEE